jgi:uncharacterized Zn finger protein (UPF0148 family)
MNLKCKECGNVLKKDAVNEDQAVICPICETQYKVVSTPDGKQHLEEFTFNGSDAGEL